MLFRSSDGNASDADDPGDTWCHFNALPAETCSFMIWPCWPLDSANIDWDWMTVRSSNFLREIDQRIDKTWTESFWIIHYASCTRSIQWIQFKSSQNSRKVVNSFIWDWQIMKVQIHSPSKLRCLAPIPRRRIVVLATESSKGTVTDHPLRQTLKLQSCSGRPSEIGTSLEREGSCRFWKSL